MVAHLVHKESDVQLGIIVVVFRAGEVNNDIAKPWLRMPEKAGMTSAVDDVMINVSDSLLKNITYL